jgi:hypothetical protein
LVAVDWSPSIGRRRSVALGMVALSPLPPEYCVLDAASLDGMLAALRSKPGAPIWFSWSGGPAQRRTPAHKLLLKRLRASGVHVELRSDSTLRSRVIRP